MKTLSWFFFYSYVISLIVAGGLGFFTARFDHRLLFGLDPAEAGSVTGVASMVSQYRFMRALECGFGVFAYRFRREIFTERPFNRVFLGTMTAGVAARLVSLVMDGFPFPVFYFFAGFELAGALIIFGYTRKRLSLP